MKKYYYNKNKKKKQKKNKIKVYNKMNKSLALSMNKIKNIFKKIISYNQEKKILIKLIKLI